MFDEKDVRDLNEEVQTIFLEELKKLNPEDPKAKQVAETYQIIAGVADSYDRRDAERINNNMKNDLEEQKLVIEMRRQNNERIACRLDLVTKVMYAFGAGVFSFYAYNQEQLKLGSKRLIEAKDNLMRLILHR